jgi:hypothetical protein
MTRLRAGESNGDPNFHQLEPTDELVAPSRALSACGLVRVPDTQPLQPHGTPLLGMNARSVRNLTARRAQPAPCGVVERPCLPQQPPRLMDGNGRRSPRQAMIVFSSEMQAAGESSVLPPWAATRRDSPRSGFSPGVSCVRVLSGRCGSYFGASLRLERVQRLHAAKPAATASPIARCRLLKGGWTRTLDSSDHRPTPRRPVRQRSSPCH